MCVRVAGACMAAEFLCVGAVCVFIWQVISWLGNMIMSTQLFIVCSVVIILEASWLDTALPNSLLWRIVVLVNNLIVLVTCILLQACLTVCTAHLF